MMFKKKKTNDFDSENMIPVIRCSICTGEQSAGFKDKRTGKFKEIMLIRTPEDLDEFKSIYRLDEVHKEY